LAFKIMVLVANILVLEDRLLVSVAKLKVSIANRNKYLHHFKIRFKISIPLITFNLDSSLINSLAILNNTIST